MLNLADKKTEGLQLDVNAYIERQSTRDFAIFKLLNCEIQVCLPEVVPKIYHSSPIWFVEGNAVLRIRVTAQYAFGAPY